MANFFGFPKSLIRAMVCQPDKTLLKIENEAAGDFILNGFLSCPNCGQSYEIKDGILNLLTGQSKLNKISIAEANIRDSQAEKYNERLSPRFYKEVEPTIKSLGGLTDKKIVEYGCGTGRFTLELENKCGQILAVDFSLESLHFLAKNLKTDKVGLVLADATQLVTAADHFDLAFSAQFLEHVNTKGLRDRFLINVKNSIKLGGMFVCTVYHHDLRRVIKKEAKEGYHEGMIFYHYFERSELMNEFNKFFEVIYCRPIDITLPFESRLALPKKIGGRLSKLASQLAVLNKFGHLLLIKAKK